MATTNITIDDAKALAVKHRKVGVLVVAFAGDKFQVVTYGMTRKLCDAMRVVNDQIADLIADGTIRVPDSLRGEVK